MNTRPFTALAILVAAIAWPASGLAAGPAVVTIDCQNPRLPGQRQVAGLLGIDNFSQAYDARAKLMVRASRACKQLGAETIQLVLQAEMLPPQRRLAGTTRP